jgi:PleD family two-component response regulator
MAEEEKCDLIVLDIVLPGEDGFEVCKKLKANPKTLSIPVIFLTACGETKERVKGLRLGAIDYMVKPFDLDELAERIDIALRIKTDLRESAVDEPARNAVSEPPLEREFTGEVLHREEFMRLVDRRFKTLDPATGLLTLAFIRADQENILMGEEGHEIRSAYEAALRETIKDLAPKGTCVGEIDPIQVALLIPRKNKYGAELLLDELRNLLAMRSFGNQGNEHHITVSCGVAEYPNARIDNARQFEEMAESALRRAQRSGGDQTVLL